MKFISVPSKRNTIFFLVMAIVILSAHYLVISPWMLDDAFISFRYAENIASGNGPVFNSGERVEGYTNFLWVILLGLGRMAGLDIVILSKWLGVIFSLLTLFLVLQVRLFLSGFSREQGWIAVFLLATCGTFTAWAGSGMEVSMYTFLVTVSVLFYLKIRRARSNLHMVVLGILLAFTAMTRPDGLLLVFIIFLDSLLTVPRGRLDSTFFLFFIFSLIYLPYFLWRFLYYGFLLPNTFYAKVGWTFIQVWRGLKYTGEFLLITGPMILAAILGLIILFQKKRQPAEAMSISAKAQPLKREFSGVPFWLMWIILGYSLYVILVGGDAMPAFRFFTPIVPLLVVFVVGTLSLLLKNRICLTLVVLFLALFNLFQTYTANRMTLLMRDKVAFWGKHAGLWMKQNCPENTVIATNAAGSVPYYSKLYTIDMLGITNPHIALEYVPDMGKGNPGHEKGDGLYILSRFPDIIQFGSSLGSSFPIFKSDREIFRNPLFRKLYQPYKIELTPGIIMVLYIKNSFRNRLFSGT